MCGKDDSSDEMLAMQKQEAKEARVKDEERRARIAKAVGDIEGIYKGKEVTTPTTAAYDWSTFKAPATGNALANALKSGDRGEAQGIPEGYTYGTKKMPKGPGVLRGGGMTKKVWVPGPDSDAGKGHYEYVADPSAGGGTGGGTTTQKGFYGPDGVFHPQGSSFDVTTQTGTGEFSGGFNDEFYDKYRSAMTGYYIPQVQDKYKQAQDETTYALARAGTLNSSAAIDKVAELLKQKEDQEAKVYNVADTAVGEMKTRIGQEMSNAINQAHAVEDPEIAVSSALDRAENITAEAPDLSPLGDIFKVAMIGASKFAEGRQAARVRDQLAQGSQAGGYLVPTA